MSTILARFIGGSLDGQAKRITRMHGGCWNVHVPEPIAFPMPGEPFDPSLARAKVETYRRIGTVRRRKMFEDVDVMAIDTMPGDVARKALDDLVVTLNREYAEAHRCQGSRPG